MLLIQNVLRRNNMLIVCDATMKSGHATAPIVLCIKRNETRDSVRPDKDAKRPYVCETARIT